MVQFEGTLLETNLIQISCKVLQFGKYLYVNIARVLIFLNFSMLFCILVF